jgi:hypothetical protein
LAVGGLCREAGLMLFFPDVLPLALRFSAVRLLRSRREGGSYLIVEAIGFPREWTPFRIGMKGWKR